MTHAAGGPRNGAEERGAPRAPAPSAPPVLCVHPRDDVAVALRPLAAGEAVRVDRVELVATTEIAAGHKIALRAIPAGSNVVKYGFPIGRATRDVAAGDWVHSHNLETRLGGPEPHTGVERPSRATIPAAPVSTPDGAFAGYRRSDGRVGTRNDIWIVNTVGCVNFVAERIAKLAGEQLGGRGTVDGVYAFAHPYGCSQLGDDLDHTQRVLAGLIRHPNAGGVLVLGLGCENNQLEALLRRAGPVDPARVRYFNTQDVMSELEQGVDSVVELAGVMRSDRREPCPVSDLVLGHKCGGSDGFSGISANPLLGRIADRVTAGHGRVLLSEIPEMFGAERVLLERAASAEVFDALARVVDDFKAYFIRHGQPVHENPSPGNKAGGLTTLEEKSLGAVQKGGSAVVSGVLRYGEPVTARGLSIVEAPGNDAVSSTAVIAAGATLLLFTTGRGTPLGFPVPTLKVSSNTGLAERKPHWIDFNAGAVLDGAATLDELADGLMAHVLEVASGRPTNNEVYGYREIAIWKDGVTL